MKKFKAIVCLFLVLVMAVGLAGCGSFEMKMLAAAKKMEKLQSYRMDMDMDIGLRLSLLGESTDLEMSIDGTVDVNTDPKRTKTELGTELLGSRLGILSYSEKEGERTVSYVSQDGGKTWVKRSAEGGKLGELADKDKIAALLKLAKSFEESGTETVRGSEATVFAGDVQGADIGGILEATGLLGSLAEAMDLDEGLDIDFAASGSVPVTIAIDKKSGMIVRYTMDLSEIMQNVMPGLLDQLVASASAEAGLEDLNLGMFGFELEVGKVFVTAELYDFDAVGPIEIPAAAREAEETAPAA